MPMPSTLRPLALGLALLFAPSLLHAAGPGPGLLTQGGGLWYRSSSGAIRELPAIGGGQTEALRALAVPITLADLGRIPLGAPPLAPAAQDLDRDGLDDEYERAFETDPRRADTDGDRFPDREEIVNGYSPLKKAVRMPLASSVYARVRGRFVWEPVRRQLWYVSASVPRRFFVTTRASVAWTQLQAAAAPTTEAIGCRVARPACGAGLTCTGTNTCAPIPPSEPARPSPAPIPAPIPTPAPEPIPAPTPVPAPPTPEPLAECLPERCTRLDWKTRAALLAIPEYRREVAADGRLHLRSGPFEVVMPDDAADAEPFGRIQLYQLVIAYRNTVALLGRVPFALPDVIKEEFVLNHPNTGSCCGSQQEGHPLVWNLGTQDRYLSSIALEDANTAYYKRIPWDDVVGNHELTHRFIHTLDLSSMLNEGLANFAQDHGRPQSMRCEATGYRQGDDILRPYTLYSCPAGEPSAIYDTGDCFWQQIESRYGLETFRRIIARLYDKPDRERALIYYPRGDGTPFSRAVSYSGQVLVDLQQAIVPEVGPRFWTDFVGFGFSPTMAEGKTYAGEMAACGQGGAR